MIDKNAHDYIEREHGYLLAYNDMHKVLADMVTYQNKELMQEISERLAVDLEIRKETGFIANQSMFKKF